MESNAQDNRLESLNDRQNRLCSEDPGKTRDLPKLSECQSCGLRFDACTGKNRIRLLYSEWRVLLLCKKCLLLVEGSEMCSYCFKKTSSRGKFVRCSQCGRSVHELCFLEYKTVPPWCYQCSGRDVSICVDCWVPKPIASKRGVLTVKRCDKSYRVSEEENSTASNGGDCANLLKEVVNGATRMFGNNVALPRGMERGVRRASQANFGSVASSDDSCESSRNGDVNAVDDIHLSIQLHSVVNSSPKISSNLVSSGSPCSTVRGARLPSEGDTIRRFSHVRNCNGSLKPEACSDGSFGEIQDDGSGRNVNKKISVEEGGMKPMSRFYVRTRWKYDEYKGTIPGGTKKMSHSFMKGHDRCLNRWMNVYKRTRWKNGICKRNSNVGLGNRGSRMMEVQQRCSALPMKVFARTRLKKSKCMQKPNSDIRIADVRFFEVEELEGQNKLSDRFTNVYVRTGLKGGKSVQKLSGACSNEESILKDEKWSKDIEEKRSAGLMNVYSRTRLKRVEFLQKPSGVIENPEWRSSDGKESHPADVNHSCRGDLHMKSWHDQDDCVEVGGEEKNEERDRYSIKYYRKLSSKSYQEKKVLVVL